ncbi:hypothetical protein [Actinocrispum wychmicini]|uniref:Excalibur calcium-binding domain-containing protein n=1 Tax=Actinocrispum wychmicini TaxID=1213861 RepID=A0A4R2ISU6_9PSEU|nr:hypothetical protein [Actinocrispum wychmicini]TCO48137.1 hypothetical protein EV192_116190 [Actinocrispum wychmicini]
MTENSSAGLFMFRPEVTVTVTREEHHQSALSRYRVGAGASRRVAVQLAWCTIGSGKYKGERAIEVRLDGERVGELTYAMSQRYGLLLDTVAGRGGRAGCEASVFLGKRGIEIELLLPRDTSAASVDVPKVTMAAVDASATTVTVTDVPTPRADVGKGTFAKQKPAWITAGAVAVVAFLAAIGSQDNKPAPSSSSPAVNFTTTTTSATATATIGNTAPASTIPQSSAPPETNTSTTKPHATSPAKQPPAAPPKTSSTTAEEPPAGKCDPNYSGCVPIASDVDCEGGGGNGPAFVKGPIRVIGKDIYDLDRDHNGIACE